MVLSLLLALSGKAQENQHFSLRQAVDYGLEHNAQIQKAHNNVLKAKKKVWEATSMGLPQIDGSTSYQKFIEQPVNMLPEQIMNPQAPPDNYVAVKFGFEQNMKWSATLKQLIFSGSYLVGLQSSRTYKKISENAEIKTRQKIRELIVNVYGNALLADESIKIMQHNIELVSQNLFEVEQMYKNGLVEETDVEQLKITLANLKNQSDYLQRMRKTAYEMLNFSMGRDIGAPLHLSDTIEDFEHNAQQHELTQKQFSAPDNIDYIIAENMLKAKELQVKFEKSKALPVIAAFVNYGKNAYNNDFVFFKDTQEWYAQSIFGISINIPIFSSLGRTVRFQQAKLDMENARIDLTEKEKQLQLQFDKARNEYEHSIENYNIAKENLRLAEKIEHKEQIKFKEGVGNSFQWHQAQMQLFSSQQQFLQSVIDIIRRKTELENLTGTM